MSDYISEDLLVVIFKYLPAETLLRFRSVCKGWKQLIDSPSFLQEHISAQNPRFIAEYGRKYLIIDPRPRPLVNTLTKPIQGKQFILVGTLHGVVCLYETDGDFLLWNPSIRKFTWLPSCFDWHDGDQIHTCYGFWIDPSSKEYKIIILQRRGDLSFYLYSSIRRAWIVLPMGKLGNWKSCKQGPPVMIAGVAHWGGCVFESTSECNREHDHRVKVIMSFDFVHESFDVIVMPDLKYYRAAPCRWQGTLSLVCWNTDTPRGCQVYSRQEDSWVKMFDFKVYQPILHAFWAMEDMEIRTKKGKRKRETEERVNALAGETQENARILATVISDPGALTGALVLNGAKSGSKTVGRRLADPSKVNISYDFVESLLFPMEATSVSVMSAAD